MPTTAALLTLFATLGPNPTAISAITSPSEDLRLVVWVAGTATSCHFADGVRFGAAAIGFTTSRVPGGGFIYAAPGTEIRGRWAAPWTGRVAAECVQGGSFIAAFRGELNGHPVTGRVTVLDRLEDGPDRYCLSVYGSKGQLLWRDQGRLPDAALRVIAGPVGLGFEDAFPAALFAAFGVPGDPGGERFPYAPFMNWTFLEDRPRTLQDETPQSPAWVQLVEKLRRALSGDARGLSEDERRRVAGAVETISRSLEEINRDGKITPEDFDAVRALNRAIETLEEILGCKRLEGSSLGTLIDIVKSLGRSIQNGLRRSALPGGLPTIKELTSSQAGQTTTIDVKLNEGEGAWEVELVSKGLGLFGLELEIHKDTQLRWTGAGADTSLTATPGTVRIDFDDFTIFGLHVIGPRLPDDLWFTRATLRDRTLIIEGSLDQDGSEPRRYEFNLGNGRVAVYDGNNNRLDEWKIDL